jgi:hypothetical protein
MSISIRVRPASFAADIHITGIFIHIAGIRIHIRPESIFTSLRNPYSHRPEYAPLQDNPSSSTSKPAPGTSIQRTAGKRACSSLRSHYLEIIQKIPMSRVRSPARPPAAPPPTGLGEHSYTDRDGHFSNANQDGPRPDDGEASAVSRRAMRKLGLGASAAAKISPL